MSKHTPGPWKVSENKRERTVQIDTADGRGTVVQPGAITWLPDAPLIAAAPEMYTLLLAYRVRETHVGPGAAPGLLDRMADALLAKIDGAA